MVLFLPKQLAIIIRWVAVDFKLGHSISNQLIVRSLTSQYFIIFNTVVVSVYNYKEELAFLIFGLLVFEQLTFQKSKIKKKLHLTF